MLASYCLALAIFHEARGLDTSAWAMVMDNVKVTSIQGKVCKNYFSSRYSTKAKTRISKKEIEKFNEIHSFAKRNLNTPIGQKRTYFNSCYLGKRFKTKFSPILKRKNKMCLIFY